MGNLIGAFYGKLLDVQAAVAHFVGHARQTVDGAGRALGDGTGTTLTGLPASLIDTESGICARPLI